MQLERGNDIFTKACNGLVKTNNAFRPLLCLTGGCASIILGIVAYAKWPLLNSILVGLSSGLINNLSHFLHLFDLRVWSNFFTGIASLASE